MWDWNLYENPAVLEEGRRRSLCACITAIFIGSVLLALLGILSPNSPPFYGVIIGGGLILLMGIAGIVIICVYYPMNWCRRRDRSRTGVQLQMRSTDTSTMKPPSAVPEYESPPTYQEAISKDEAV